MTPEQAAHYQLLRLIEHQPEISQRDLAQAMGVSLGKAHYLLKALLGKGLVKADNFRRSDNKLAYAYLLTPSGIAAKLELTRAFLRLKEQEYEAARREITRLRQELDTSPGLSEWKVFQTSDDLYEALCARIREIATAAITERGCFTLVVKGGAEVAALCPRLRDMDTSWGAWQVFLDGGVDGGRQVFDAWLSHVPVPAERITEIPAEGMAPPTPQEADLVGADMVLLSLTDTNDGREMSASPYIEVLARGSEVAVLAIGPTRRELLGLLARKAPHPIVRLVALADLHVWADAAAAGG